MFVQKKEHFRGLIQHFHDSVSFVDFQDFKTTKQPKKLQKSEQFQLFISYIIHEQTPCLLSLAQYKVAKQN